MHLDTQNSHILTGKTNDCLTTKMLSWGQMRSLWSVMESEWGWGEFREGSYVIEKMFSSLCCSIVILLFWLRIFVVCLWRGGGGLYPESLCFCPDHTRMQVIASFNLHVLTCASFDHQLAMLALAWVDLRTTLTGSNFIASFFFKHANTSAMRLDKK